MVSEIKKNQIDEMIELAKAIKTSSGVSSSNPFADRMATIIQSPESKHFLIRLMDVAFRSHNFDRVSRTIEVLFTGAKVMGVEQMLKWEMSENMTRPKSDLTKVNMNYNIVAPHMYQGRIDSLVGRITGFADMIQLTHLKLQQVLSRMVPDGVYLDADGLAEVDLGNGTNYNPQEATDNDDGSCYYNTHHNFFPFSVCVTSG